MVGWRHGSMDRSLSKSWETVSVLQSMGRQRDGHELVTHTNAPLSEPGSLQGHQHLPTTSSLENNHFLSITFSKQHCSFKKNCSCKLAKGVTQTVKNLPADAGDQGSIPGSGRFPEGGNGNPLQDSCLENPPDREAWRATVHTVTKNWTRLSN